MRHHFARQEMNSLAWFVGAPPENARNTVRHRGTSGGGDPAQGFAGFSASGLQGQYKGLDVDTGRCVGSGGSRRTPTRYAMSRSPRKNRSPALQFGRGSTLLYSHIRRRPIWRGR